MNEAPGFFDAPAHQGRMHFAASRCLKLSKYCFQDIAKVRRLVVAKTEV